MTALERLETAAEWFARFPDLAKQPVFILHVRLGLEGGVEHGCTIRAYEGPACSRYGHTTLYCELTYGTKGAATRAGSKGRAYTRKVLFPRESFWVGVAPQHSIDGNDAKALVLSLFAMKPGDTDAEFFEHYTPEQLAFCVRWGDTLTMVSIDRYGER